MVVEREQDASTPQAILTSRLDCCAMAETMKDMYGPRCWHGCEADPGGFAEDDVVPGHEGVQLSSGLDPVELGRPKGAQAFSHRAWETCGRKSQLDYILGPKVDTCATYTQRGQVEQYMEPLSCVCYDTGR